MNSRCPIGKIRYMTPGAAEMTINDMLRKRCYKLSKDTRERLEPYRCPYCGFYHLGKRPLHLPKREAS